MPPYDLVCIGSGPAGETAATLAGSVGRRVAVVERDARPGGATVNTGTVPSKALRETALLCTALRRRPLPGVSAEVSRNRSIGKLMTQRYRVQYQEHDRIERVFDRCGVDVYRGHGRIVDPGTVRVEAVDGTTTDLETAFILVATGSSPLRPDHIPFGRNVVDADGILELPRVPDSVIIAGGGVVGCEYACVLRGIGVEVTLIDRRAELLGFLDRECRDHLVRSMIDDGVEIRLNTEVEKVAIGDDDAVLVHLDDESGEEPARCEVLLWATGRSANSAGIGLEDAGVSLGKRGTVPVNESCRTNVPSIYAAGDVTGFPALSSTAVTQGRIAASQMFGIGRQSRLVTLPYALYTIPAVSTVGLTEREAAEETRPVVVGRAPYRDCVRGRMLGEEHGMVKCVFDGETGKLLGATVVGDDACELIHVAQFVLASDGGIDELLDACVNSPSLTELYKLAACDAQGQIAARPVQRAA